MTRGKQAIAAANRRAYAAVESDITTYQRKVAELTKERNDLRDKLAKVRVDTAELIRRLKAERDAATGPQLAALRLKIDQARIDLQQQRANVGAEFYRIAIKHGLSDMLDHDRFVNLHLELAALFGVSQLGEGIELNRESRRLFRYLDRHKFDKLEPGDLPQAAPVTS